MREEYMIERSGKKFVLYAGLLEEAHSRGLRSIETDLIQIPSADNGDVAIVKAVVRTEDGKFTGIGDASPENVGRNIVPHAIRMAETRAKARALRDAINVGATAFEELGGEEDGSGASAVPPTRASSSGNTSGRRSSSSSRKPAPEDAPNTSRGGAQKARKYKMKKETRDVLADLIKEWKDVETNRAVLKVLDAIAEKRGEKVEDWTDEYGLELAAWIQEQIDEEAEAKAGAKAGAKAEEEPEEEEIEFDEDDLEQVGQIAGE
jgi:hypothetical protein